MEDQIKLLETKNKSLSDQLDKITADLFRMQDNANELHAKLEDKAYGQKLAGWGVDLAVQAARSGLALSSKEEFTDVANYFCNWVMSQSYTQLKPVETMQ